MALITKIDMKFLIFFLFPFGIFKQNLSATDIVSKSINAHDSSNNFGKFQGTFLYQIERQNQTTRNFSLVFDKRKSSFSYIVNTDSVSFKQKFIKGKCILEANNSKLLSPDLVKKYDITCERTQYLEKVYNYLFGLPFKLKDPGVILKEKYIETEFNGKQCYELAIEFDKNIGADQWYFYFDKKDFLLAGYKFHHDVSKKDGEFIYLNDYEKINGIIMAKTKKWHWNQTNEHFSTDKLVKGVK
jgi:hypothetical protein